MSEEPQLAPNVFFCVAQGHGVFLDLKRDAYSAVPMSAPGEGTPDALGARLSSHTDELLAAGLLSDEPGWMSPLGAFRAIAAPERQLFEGNDERAFGMTRGRYADFSVSVGDGLAMLRACRRASRALRTSPIEAVVADLRRRRDAAKTADHDLDRVRSVVAAFRRLRPWYPRGYLCLYDSLALLNFLIAQGIRANWIFGVQTMPFGAHCWVQLGDILLNDSVEYARQFTPIMQV